MKTNVKLFADYPNLCLEEYDASKKMLVAWGQVYDVEHLQIERFLLELR